MIKIMISTVIEAPIQRVFEYMSAPENDIEWQDGVLATSMINNDLNKRGVYFRHIGHLLGHRNVGTYQVIETASNHVYRFKSLSGPLHMHTAYTFEKVDGGTKLDISIHVSNEIFFKINEKILKKRLEYQLEENIEVLKKRLE